MKWFFLLFIPSVCLGAGLVNGTLSPAGGGSSSLPAAAVGVLSNDGANNLSWATQSTGSDPTKIAISGGSGINNILSNVTFYGATGLTNPATLWISPVGSSSGIRGDQAHPFALLSQALVSAQAGDTIIQLPGTYNEPSTSFLTLPKNCYWYSYPGAINVFAPTNGNTGANALVAPSDNDYLVNPTVLVSVTAGQFYTPIGAGGNNVGMTNVLIDNGFVTNDVDGFFLATSTNCQWTLRNCRAITCFDTYNQVNSAGHSALLINCVFTVTNSTTTASTGQTRRCIANGGGNIKIVGGLLTIADPAGDTNYSAAISQSVSGSTNFILQAPAIDSRGLTNANSVDIYCAFANATWGEAYRVDGKPLMMRTPLNAATVRMVFPSFGVNAGSAANPSIYTITTGTNNSGYGIYFPGQTNIGFAVASNPVVVIDANTSWFSNSIYAPTNAAPITTIAPSGLNTIALNKGWTNNLGSRADLLMNVFLPTGNTNFLVLTNSTTGECYTNAYFQGSGAGITGNFTAIFPDISPNDTGTLSNYTQGGGSVMVIIPHWKLR